MSRDSRVSAGVRLAVTTFTVLPVRPGRIDRSTAAVAMAVAPVLGVALGVTLGVVLLVLTTLGAPPLVAGAATVGLGALVTRGLHLDGLADTVDALGSHRPRADALAIMKKPDVGPFGVAALSVVLLLQSASVAALPARGWLAAVAAVAAATAAGRLAVSWACRRGIPAARPEGLGALVAGTVSPPVLAVATPAVAAVGLLATPGRPWQGPLAVGAALAVTVALLRHVVRRLGGVTGDVLGAAVEVTTTLTLLGLVLGG
ncbi:MAG TPA: adenosylcobinamide-GDP ribazoletransferase [Micromonospora sp.]